MTILAEELGPKKLELVHELVPKTSIVGVLVNPANAATEPARMRAAAEKLGLQLDVLRASTEAELDDVFTALLKKGAGALVIGPDVFFNSRVERLAALALRHLVPVISEFRQFPVAGGLMSYGGNIADSYRLVGVYTGRILKGEKPADLPVQQSTKVEMIINLRTAKALGIAVPPTLLASADEVIE